MALIELASSSTLQCDQLVVCLDRSMDPANMSALVRDLGWVGFELTTLAPWTGADVTSKKWLMLAMET